MLSECNGTLIEFEEHLIRAVFLDRDGVINRYLRDDYVKCPEELHLLPGADEAIRFLNSAGIFCIVVSNQQGVGRGIMTAEQLDNVDRALKTKLSDASGAVIDASYYCTALRSDNSDRRKPMPGMLFEAANDFGFDLGESILIGDSPTDIAAGHRAGVAGTILVLSGATPLYSTGQFEPGPDMVCENLKSAIDNLKVHL